MKKVAELANGNVLLELDPIDSALVEVIFVQLKKFAKENRKEAQELPVAPGATKRRTPAAKSSSPAPNPQKRVCVICGQPMPAGRSKNARCCSEKCVAEKNRRYARRKYEQSRSATETTAEPARPAVDKAARRRLIQEAAARIEARREESDKREEAEI